MKLHLQAALLLTLLAGTATAVGTYTPKAVILVDSNRAATEEDITKLTTGRYSEDGSGYNNPDAIVKDGAGTLTINQSATLYNPFIVREGTVEVSGAELVNQTKVQNYTSNLLIGGKAASLVLDNASYVQDTDNGAASVSAIAIGTSDGKGSLSLKNNSYMSTGQFIFAGYSSGLGGYAAGTYAGTDTTEVYNQGESGRSSIYLSESQLSAGTSLQFANVDVTIDAGGILSDNYRGKDPATTPIAQDPASYLGYNGKTVINVNAGGTLDLNWNVSTGFASSTDIESSTVINVNGENAKISVAGVADFGGGESWWNAESSTYTPEGATSSTSVSITGGAVGEFNEVNIGECAAASLTVDADSSVVAYSEESDALLTIMGKGTLENSGTVGIATVVDGGALTLNGGSMAAVTLNSGDIYVNGATTTGALTLNGGEVTFKEGAMLDLMGKELVLDGATITLVLSEDSELAENYTLFTGAAQAATYEVNVVNEKGAAVGTATLTVAAVPEPTTATLSLLALAALAARRRRR